MAKFKTIITTAGAAKIAAVLAGTGSIVLDNTAKMAVGDGGGTLPTPNPAQTKLVNEVHRAPINRASIDASDPKNIVAELVIPPGTGGFWIREMALYDAAGTLLAVGNMAETYKPSLSEGAGRKMVIRMVIAVSEVSAITITMDTTTVMATQDYVDSEIDKHAKSRNHPDATLTAKGFTQLNSATNSASETQAATPKAVKTVMDATNLKAPLASPALTGTPTAPTAAPGTNNTQLSTTAFVQAALAALVNSSPAVLDTLGELAAALGNDPNFATTMANALGLKAPLDSPALTGIPTGPTAAKTVNTTQLATTAFVKAVVADYATKASPALTGTPTAPTAAAGNNTTQIATTAFVQAAVTALINASPAALDTLKELADALGNDPNFATTMATALGLKAPLDSPALTGIPTGPTADKTVNTVQLATTAFVKAVVADYATKASPALTGVPTAPTAAAGTNTTQLSTTAFVQAAITALQTAINAALSLKAPLASPALTGTPTAPTAAQTVNNTQIATTAFVKAAIAAIVNSSPAALDTLKELADALGNDANFATTMTNALAGKQPKDTTLTNISGKDVPGLLQYLGMGTAAKKNTGSDPGDVVTAGSDQPVYNSTLPTSGYLSTARSGYMGEATVTGGDTLVRVVGLIAHNIAGNWTLVNSYGSHFGTGGSIQPNDAAHVFVSTDGAGYTRRWYLYNNGRLVGPTGDFADQAWVTGKIGSVSGVTSTGEGIDVQKVKIPALPNIGYNATSSRGILATATAQSDSLTKAHSIQLNNPGAGGWGLNMSWGTYTGASGTVDDVAHLLCSTDGAAYVKRWWFYNNGEAVGPAGKLYSEKNTTRAADGTLKAASPVVKIYADGRAVTNAESEGCTVTRSSVGEYLIKGCVGLNADAAWGGVDGGFDVPTDRNKQPLIWLDYEVNADGSVLVKTYHRTHPDAPVFARNERVGFTNGDPIDIPSDQFISVRVEMPDDCIYQQKQAAERQAAYEAWLAMLQQMEEEAYQEDQAREEARQAAEAEQARLAVMQQTAKEVQQGNPEQPDGDAQGTE